MNSEQKNGSEKTMTNIIENIIMLERKQEENFREHQTARIAELNKLRESKRAGKDVDAKDIISKLQRAGILDKKGNLSKVYQQSEK